MTSFLELSSSKIRYSLFSFRFDMLQKLISTLNEFMKLCMHSTWLRWNKKGHIIIIITLQFHISILVCLLSLNVSYNRNFYSHYVLSHGNVYEILFFDINYIFSLLNIEILMKQRRTLLIQENLTSPKVASLINVQLCHAPRAQSNYWFLEVTIIIDNCVLHISIQCCWQNIFLIIFIYLLFLPRFH